jgi:trimeric autotransporter adhesin
MAGKQKGNILMNPLIQLKKAASLFLVALVCFGLLPTMQALSPAPDGGYLGGNTAEGQNALFGLTTGGYNTAVGFFSLRSDSTNSFNTAIGAGTLLANTADSNTATGAAALFSNTIGSENTATGTFALFSNTAGFNNTAIGTEALFSNTTGHGNTADGIAALSSNTTGSGNTALGFSAGSNVTTATNVICIGAAGADVTNSCFIRNIRGVTTQNADAIPVLVDSNNQLGTISSSRRFKKEIKPMDKASEAILAVKPVTFHYKSDKTSTPQFGLIAEDVAAVNPDLVVRDGNGEIYTVRYDAVNAMLLNEFLKEHHRVEEQDASIAQQKRDFQAKIVELEATIAQQQKGMAVLSAQLKEQAAQIQNVSAQLEASKPAPQVVNNR